MPERVLICGSIAFDTIMVFPDRFRRHILPEQSHILSVAFEVNELRREFGGTAGNIAYTLKMVGGEPIVMATVGEDADTYRRRLEKLGIATDCLRAIPDTYTAQAYITTDLDDNQITAFHAGAMNHSHQTPVSAAGDVALAILAPDGREGMLAHSAQLAQQGTPFIFDPGQGMPLFSGEELVDLVDRATHVAVNDYEAELLRERTGLDREAIAARLAARGGALIVTLGARGSHIYCNGQRLEIPPVAASAEVDPTGCGDAYRAGLLHGLVSGWDWRKTGRFAALLGAIKVASRGAQNHQVSRDELASMYGRHFDEALW
jgi:adenosine kinase